jgi:predicted nucleotidyltransferase
VTGEHLSPDLREFLRLLANHDVRYVVVGGEAVIHHGYPRLTGDIDLFYDASPANCERLYAALEEFWGGDVPSLSDASELSTPDLVLQYGVPPNRIDLLSRITAVSFEAAWAGRVETTLIEGDVETPLAFIGLAELVRNKTAAGRHKDLDDVEHLVGLLRSDANPE